MQPACCSSRFLRLRDDQAGDNIYYMGFLYTLTSLAAALYQFNASGDSEYIVQNFGVAIASTIAGILFRVMWNQMRRDPAEVERNARVELAEASRRVRVELDQTVLEFNGFRRGLQQSLREGFDEISRQVETVGNTLLKGLEEVTEKSAAPLEAASKSSGATIDEMTKQVVAALEASARKLLRGEREAVRQRQGHRRVARRRQGTPDGDAGAGRGHQDQAGPDHQGAGSAVDRFTARIDQHEKAMEGVLEEVRRGDLGVDTRGGRVPQSHDGGIRERVREASTSILGALQSFETASKSQSGQVDVVLKRTDETLRAIREMATAASERDNKQSEVLSKLMSSAVNGGGEPIQVTVRPQPAPAEPASRRSMWSLGGR